MLNTTTDVTIDYLARLVDELLDAHADTIELVAAPGSRPEAWAAHLDYLQGLQRVGHAALARVPGPS